MPLALIAGDGTLPEVIAQRLAARGEAPVVYALREDTGAFANTASAVVPLPRVEIAAALKDMAARGIREALMAGFVPKTVIFSPSMMDASALELLSKLDVRDDHSLLGAVVTLLEKTGLKVSGYRDLLADLLAKPGKIAGRDPSDAERDDIAYGVSIAKAVTPLSFGQSVVVAKKSVVAVEAMEGTDATILRAGSLCKGGAVIKMMRTDQDERYDIPIVGPQTIRLMARAGLKCLALHAGWVITLDPEEFAKAAEEESVAVVGFTIER